MGYGPVVYMWDDGIREGWTLVHGRLGLVLLSQGSFRSFDILDSSGPEYNDLLYINFQYKMSLYFCPEWYQVL